MSLKKIVTMVTVLFLLFSFSVYGAGEQESKAEETAFTEKNPEDYKGSISVWSFTNEPAYFIEHFNKVYPNIEVEFTHISGGEEYISKVESARAAGRGMPDLFTAEISWLKRWVNTDLWDSLSEAPYNAAYVREKTIPYVTQLATDNDENLKALSIQATPGGIFYRRSIAEKYLGTDDPEEVGKMIDTMEEYLSVGEKIREESNGRVNLIGGWKDLRWFPLNAREKPWVVDGKLIVEDAILDYYDLAKQVRTENITAKVSPSDPSWYAGMQDGSIFSYILPTWGLHFELKPGAEPDVENPANYSGDWAVTKSPQPFYWGGTWMGIYNESKNKELAWQFLKYYALDEDMITYYAKDKGDFVSNLKVVEKIRGDFSEPFLGGQNHYDFFADAAMKIDASNVTQYDQHIEKFLLDSIDSYVEGRSTKAEAVSSFKEDVHNAFPEISIQ